MIALLRDFEAVKSGEVLIVQLPSNWQQYAISGKVLGSRSGHQITIHQDEVLQKYTPPVKTFVKVVFEDKSELSVEEYRAIQNKYIDEDGDTTYPSLEAEFEHRKQLLELDKSIKVYDETIEQFTPIELTIIGEMNDTGSKYITTPLVYGKARFSQYTEGFYNLNVLSLLADALKDFAEESNLQLTNSSHSGYRFAKLDDTYVSNKTWDDMLEGKSNRTFKTLEEAKSAENIIRNDFLNYLRAKFNKNTLDAASVAQVYTRLESIKNSVRDLDVKQKSYHSKNATITFINDLLKKLEAQ
jgi:hypothetical protein